MLTTNETVKVIYESYEKWKNGYSVILVHPCTLTVNQPESCTLFIKNTKVIDYVTGKPGVPRVPFSPFSPLIPILPGSPLKPGRPSFPGSPRFPLKY